MGLLERRRDILAAAEAGLSRRSALAGNGLPAGGGFTLTEVIVVVAIIGILAAIAIPGYKEYVRSQHRAEARSVLLEAAQFMQRFHAENARYDLARSGAVVRLPPELRRAPASGAARYTISLGTVSTTAYLLQATPTGSMTGDKCGTFTLSSVGRKDVAGATVSAADCWR